MDSYKKIHDLIDTILVDKREAYSADKARAKTGPGHDEGARTREREAEQATEGQVS